jgi:hypothetical protein
LLYYISWLRFFGFRLLFLERYCVESIWMWTILVMYRVQVQNVRWRGTTSCSNCCCNNAQNCFHWKTKMCSTPIALWNSYTTSGISTFGNICHCKNKLIWSYSLQWLLSTVVLVKIENLEKTIGFLQNTA